MKKKKLIEKNDVEKNAIYTMIDEEIIYELYYFKTLKTYLIN